MSRDRLQALRAQQAAQRTHNPSASYDEQQQPPNAGFPAPESRYTQHDNSYGYAPRNNVEEPAGYGYSQPRGQATRYNNNPAYGAGRDNHRQQAATSPVDFYDDQDEDTRGQRARAQTRRRPSQAAGMHHQDQPQYGGQEYSQAIPPVPSNRETSRSLRRQQQQQRQQRPEQDSYNQADRIPPPPAQDYYGAREDDSAYYEKNASQVALATGYGDPEKFKSYPPQQGKTRNLTGYQANPETYQIPVLHKDSQGRQIPLNHVPATPSPALNDSNIVSNAPVIDMNEFFDEIGSIRSAFRELENHISYLDQLHSRNLTGSGGDEVVEELEQVADQTRKLTNNLRNRIKDLQETTRIRTHGQAEQERQNRKAQIGAVREKFLEIVQMYQNMEMRNRDKAKHKIERQYQIVKPDASPEEIRQVVEGGQEVQVFAQALRQSQRSADARGVLNDVQNRHEDIKKIERTLVELFQLFQDMAVMVEEQDEQIIHIEQKAEEVVRDMEVGHNEITKAIVSAKGARKKRKICWCIGILILIAVGVTVALVVIKIVIPKINENKNNNDKAEVVKTVTATTTRDAARTSSSTNEQDNAANAGTTAAATSNANGTGGNSSPASASPTPGVGGNANVGSPIPSAAVAQFADVD